MPPNTNLMSSLMGSPQATPELDPWAQYMSGGGAKGMGRDTRYMEQLDRTQAQQLAAAEAYYEGATAPSNIQASMMRGEALRGSLGGREEGGLAAREAIYGTGAGSYGAGAAGTRMGAEARLGAADVWMSTQADRARYDMAIAQAFQQRQAAADQREQAEQAARRAREAQEAALARQTAGSVLGAGGSMVAGSGGGGGGGGGGTAPPADEQGGGYGSSKYI